MNGKKSRVDPAAPTSAAHRPSPRFGPGPGAPSGAARPHLRAGASPVVLGEGSPGGSPPLTSRPARTARRVLVRALLLLAEKEEAARPARPEAEELPDEEAVVRKGRAVARRLSVAVRAIEGLIRRAEQLAEGGGEAEEPARPLAAARSHILATLRLALVDVEQGRTDLETAFSARDLAQAVQRGR